MEKPPLSLRSIQPATHLDPSRPCKEYRGARVGAGYGVRVIGGKLKLLHRWIVEQAEQKPLKKGEVVMHTCDNPPCFLYAHLKRATQSENLLDAVNKGRHRYIPHLGEDNGGGGKLTTLQATEIQLLARDKSINRLTHRQIANQYNVSLSLVSKISVGKLWGHLNNNKISHPAKYNNKVLVVLDRLIQEVFQGQELRILDPMAGIGRVHHLGREGLIDTYGIELEKEWAKQHPRNEVGNCLELPYEDNQFEAIVVSPVYGNRMSDHHDAKDKSKRNTYRHTLGRPLHKDNSGNLQWGPAYREFHERAWREATRVLVPDGYFFLNISDHIRKGKRQYVTAWHISCLRSLGFRVVKRVSIETPRLRQGANHRTRVRYEHVIVLKRAC